jgi:hypothetical protein
MEYLMKRISLESLPVIFLTTLFAALLWSSGLLTLPFSERVGELSSPSMAHAAEADDTNDQIADDVLPTLSDSERATLHDMLLHAQAAPNRSPAIVDGDEDGTPDEALPAPPQD